MFDKILIANRGEIACRITRTAKRMGIKTVAVYSDVDQHGLHVQISDEAVALQGNKPVESYLDMKKIIQAAKATGAQAIHPGYGFLSENSEFAELCEQSDITFIGPSAESIRIMGAKNTARITVSSAGVAVLPGYDGKDQSLKTLTRHASKTGYPLLIKAVAGGGGKGMRVVNKESDFKSSLEAVKRESTGAFANDAVLLERYLPQARHIEVQIFSDSQGNTVHLYERDCSMQRRHQKVIEESPAPGISDDDRTRITDAAILCAQSINYLGAGTVEFLYTPDNQFYFMEMNTRLQVEHPVTEMVTNQDLVEWQIRIAAGEALPCVQSDIKLNGHAIEARIYAENPERDFLPSTGKIIHLSHPSSRDHIRVDTGIESADTISAFYDPMISKIISWNHDRSTAISGLTKALDSYIIFGVENNITFCKNLIQQSDFIEEKLHTRFIEKHLETLIYRNPPSAEVYDFSALYLYLADLQQQRLAQDNQADRWSPWLSHSTPSQQSFYKYYQFQFENNKTDVRLRQSGNLYYLNQDTTPITASLQGTKLEIKYPDRTTQAIIFQQNQTIYLHVNGSHYQLHYLDPGLQNITDKNNESALHSPMPGSVIDVLVQENQSVSQGECLIIIEAMKMEHQIISPSEGIVTKIRYTVGDQVEEGVPLMVIE